MKFQKILYILGICACMHQSTLANDAKVDSLLSSFEQANKEQKIQISNHLFKIYQEITDTLYTFSNKDSETYIDYMVYYWTSENAYAHGVFIESRDYSLKAIDACLKVGNKDDLSQCYNIAAISNFRLADFAQALSFAEESLKLDRESGNQENISSSLNTLAGISLAAKEFAQAQIYNRESIRVERTLNRPSIMAIRLGMGAEICVALHQVDEALDLAKEAYEIEKKGGNKSKIAIREAQLAAVYMVKEDIDEAEKYLLQAKEVFEQDGNNNSLVISLTQLGNIAISRGQNQKACEHLLMASEMAQIIGNKLLESKARKSYSQALKNINPALAVNQWERYAELTDSIYSQQLAENLSQFNVKYETAEKEHQIEIQQQQLDNRQLWLILLVVVCLAALVGLFMFWRLAELRGNANKMLVRTNLLKDRLLSMAQTEKTKDEEQKKEISQVAHEISELGAMPQIHLTKREKQIITFCCDGKLSKEIADELGISQRTVDTHKTNIFRKLGINTTIELVRYAQQAGIY